LGAELVASVAAAAPRDAASSEDASDGDNELPTADANVHSWDDNGSDVEDAWLGTEIRAGRCKAGSVCSVEVRVEEPDVDAGADHASLGRAHDEPPHAPRTTAFASRDSFAPSSLMATPEVWDVSEIDVGQVFLRAVSYRLPVRVGPDDEIPGSIMHPAVRDWQLAPELAALERRTVKQIVVDILADV
ncbi:uncharacterized protein PHACADRAFT_202528, partial [Phanerochaete carnosa HHB-10118-sp]